LFLLAGDFRANGFSDTVFELINQIGRDAKMFCDFFRRPFLLDVEIKNLKPLQGSMRRRKLSMASGRPPSGANQML
jgi:hypothetical protein